MCAKTDEAEITKRLMVKVLDLKWIQFTQDGDDMNAEINTLKSRTLESMRSYMDACLKEGDF
jgi:hypothetical protein